MKSQFLPVCYRLCTWLAALMILLVPVRADAAFFQKDYEVQRYHGKDVLCDFYVVQKEDYVIKILKQRGDIAHSDFPRFLQIFKRINPYVEDIDLIYPQQRILVPLRVLEPGTLEGQESGSVSMPVITITKLPDALKDHSEVYEVRYGDWVSRLIAERFGRPGTKSYRQGVELFRKLNPEIEDLDKIQEGAEIRLPESDIRNEPWYDELFKDPETGETQEQIPEDLVVGSGAGQKVVSPDSEDKTEEEDEETGEPASTPPQVNWFRDLSVFARAAEIVDAELHDRGIYFFPSRYGGDFRLDLSSTPVIELGSGKKLLFTRKQGLPPGDQVIVRDYWPDLKVVYVSGEPELSWILEKLVNAIDPDGYKKRISVEDDGVLIAVRGNFIYNSIKQDSRICLNIISEAEMRTPPAIYKYLSTRHDIVLKEWVDKEEVSGWVLREPRKNPSHPEVPLADPRRNPALLVKAITETLGYQYHENVEVTFPYGGFQVKANTDMLTGGGQSEIVVDYGSLKGDAVEVIENSGFQVIQVKGFQDMEQLFEVLSEDLQVDYEKDPMYWTADRPRIRNTSVKIPGWLVSHPENSGGGLLLTRKKLAGALVDYLYEHEEVRVIQLRR
ncbi:MAG: hypothetical protein R6X08_00635 [Desulfosalsimonadaceae bacterium]